MKTAVDTNILIDILLLDEQFHQSSIDNLLKASASGRIIICEIVMAELFSAFFKNGRDEDELFSFLSDLGIDLIQSGIETLIEVGSAWNLYLSKRGNNVVCPECGKSAKIICHSCGRAISWRQHIIADFFIGAHALRHADRLLSRDRGFYKSYFPKLQIIY